MEKKSARMLQFQYYLCCIMKIRSIDWRESREKKCNNEEIEFMWPFNAVEFRGLKHHQMQCPG